MIRSKPIGDAAADGEPFRQGMGRRLGQLGLEDLSLGQIVVPIGLEDAAGDDPGLPAPERRARSFRGRARAGSVLAEAFGEEILLAWTARTDNWTSATDARSRMRGRMLRLTRKPLLLPSDISL